MFIETHKISFFKIVWILLFFLAYKLLLVKYHSTGLYFLGVLFAIYTLYLLLLLSCRFKIELDDGAIRWNTQYGVFKKKEIHLNDIQKIEICAYHEAGLGVQPLSWNFNNWLYNFGGNTTIEIRLTDGSYFKITINDLHKFSTKVKDLQKKYLFEFKDSRDLTA